MAARADSEDVKQIGRLVITLAVLALGFVCVLRHCSETAVTPLMALAIGHYLGHERGGKDE